MSAKIPTFDSQGKPNGWVLPIWSAIDAPNLRPEQVYLTAISPRARKGPHLHLRRRSMFCVLSDNRGRVLVRQKLTTGNYAEILLSGGSGFVVISPGLPCALYNYDRSDAALVLNMPSPAWSADDPDEHPVEDWQDPEGWPKS